MYDQAYIDYLAHFHGTRDYFECHEILEERWKEDTPLDKHAIWVGFIQLSVSLYHYRRGNLSGAHRTLLKAKEILETKHDQLSTFGVDPVRMLSLLNKLEENIKQEQPYQSIELPIVDEALLTRVKNRCEELHAPYGIPSDVGNAHLIHRHSMRDRSDVIEERERELQKRKGFDS